MAQAEMALPPGKTGWPVLGETLLFLKNPFGFIADRVSEHGPVFRTRLLGRDAVVFASPSATTHFIDESVVQREGSMPGHIEKLFGGRSLPLLDGGEHAARKRAVMAGFSRDALVGYLPPMQRGFEAALAAWSKQEEVVCIPEFQRLALETIAANVVGLSPGEDFDTLLEEYPKVIAGMGGLPIPLPGTTFSSAAGARDRIFDVLGRAVADHRENPRNDGLQRILDAPEKLDDEQAVLELHHVHLAGYIVFAHLASAVMNLSRYPELLDELWGEVSHAPDVSAEALGTLPLLSDVVREVKRWTPVVPTIFGQAREDFDALGHRIPKGWMLVWAPWSTSVSDECFTEPHRFDPTRFSEARSEHRKHDHAFVPQGAGPQTFHKCAGHDYSTLFLEVFLLVLLRGYRWELPDQNLELDLSKIPPEPIDGLRASFRPR